MIYPFTHEFPDLIENPTKDNIIEYHLNNNVGFSDDPFSDDFIKSHFGLDKLNTNPVQLNIGIPSSSLKKNPAKTINTPSPSFPPVGTVEGIKTYHSQPGMQESNIHSLSSEQLSIGKDIIGFFMNKGLTKEQASGIAGNLFAESSFNTEALGDKGKSFGLAQWNRGRLKNLENFAKTTKKSIKDLSTQLEFIWKELNTTEKTALKHLLEAKDSSEAAKAFAHKFERMKEYNNVRHEVAQFLNSHK